MTGDADLTFLFTDVESSSELWETAAGAMKEALDVHDALTETAIADAGGRIVKHLGDGIYAVFEQSEAALAAAIELMAALQDHEFDGLPQPFRVRMGLHTGPAIERDADWFGPTVNRAARVMSAGNGDQIVVSEATAGLCAGVDFRDCGVHELKGVGVERLFLVDSDRFTLDERALRGGRPSNLPVDTNAFVGREELIADLVHRLPDARCLTLVGPGGVGKTRVSVQVAERVARSFPDGTFFCDLDSVTDPAAVAVSVAERLEVGPASGGDLGGAIGAHLERQSALVVLDNCEHVLDAARHIVDNIVARAPNCAVLATSRQPLGRRSEQVVPVPPLDPSVEGVELLVTRARERDPSFALDPGDEDAARAICAHLDGLPLAIELTAARLPLLPVRAILDRLDDRFRLVREADGAGRQAALRDTIQWSYDLLTDDQRALFDALSWFRGGFTLEAANALAGDAVDEFDTLEGLSALVSQSMVHRDPDLSNGRFVLLESLRHFGADRLDETGRSGDVAERHRRWFGDLALEQAQHMVTERERSAWRTLGADWDNLRVAYFSALDVGDLTMAADIVESLHYYGVIALRFESLDWSESWLRQPGAERHPRAERVSAVRASAAYYQMDLGRARDLALQISTARPPDELDFRAMPFTSCWALLALGDEESASTIVDVWTAAAAPETATLFDQMMVHTAGAVLEGTVRRNLASTTRHLDRHADLARQSGSPSAIAYAHMVAGMALARLDPQRALRELAAAEDVSRTINHRHAYIDGVQTAAAQIVAAEEDMAITLRRCIEALESAAEHRFLPRIAHDLQAAAVALARSGDGEAAAVLIGASTRSNRWVTNHTQQAIDASVEPRFDELIERGRDMSLLDAADFALAELRKHEDDAEPAEEAT